MAVQLSKGQKVDLTKTNPGLSTIVVGLGWDVGNPGSDFDLDAAAFLTGAEGKVSSDDDFVFYNNLSDPCGAVVHLGDNRTGEGEGDDEQIEVQLDKLPSHVHKVSFTVTIHDAVERGQNFGQVSNAYIRVLDGDGAQELIRFDLSESFEKETAVVVAEIYRHDGQWKFAAIGSGYTGGLEALCTAFGINVSEAAEALPEPEVTPPAPAARISLLKQKVGIVLEKKQLSSVKARVALVLDVSGSMFRQYRDGAVQTIVDRILAVASRFDDDGQLDMWMFDHRLKRLPSVSERDFDGYVEREILEKYRKEIFGRNEEAPVIKDVLKRYTEEERSPLPAYVVFISDGGVRKGPELKKLLTAAAAKPVFWQFVGIGKANYGILRELDTLTDRVVDNANFFELDDYSKVTDEDLYERLLNEFPQWLKAAAAVGVIK